MLVIKFRFYVTGGHGIDAGVRKGKVLAFSAPIEELSAMALAANTVPVPSTATIASMQRIVTVAFLGVEKSCLNFVILNRSFLDSVCMIQPEH